ncbi:hypothetical protein [Paracoccus sp. ME4]
MSAVARTASVAAAGWLGLILYIWLWDTHSDFAAGWAWGTTIAALLV